jgi:predicted RNA-binding Zn ribbon-like protein
MVIRQPEFEPVETMDLTAGDTCLDFVNTGSRLQERHAGLEGEALQAAGPFGDRLTSYADLVTFAERTELLDEGTARGLRARAAAEPLAAAAVLEEARRLRESLYRTFVAAGEGEAASATDLALVQEKAAGAAARQQLVPVDGRYELAWPASTELERVLWPLATSALLLLLSEEGGRVKECAAQECNWLFLDSSKNHSRRWCDMKACGNRAKARHYYHRHQSSES